MTCKQYFLLLLIGSISTVSIILSKGRMSSGRYSFSFLYSASARGRTTIHTFFHWRTPRFGRKSRIQL